MTGPRGGGNGGGSARRWTIYDYICTVCDTGHARARLTEYRPYWGANDCMHLLELIHHTSNCLSSVVFPSPSSFFLILIFFLGTNGGTVAPPWTRHL